MLVGTCCSELSNHELQAKFKKVTSSLDDGFLGVLTKNIPNKLAPMGRSPGLLSAPPTQTLQRVGDLGARKNA